MKYLEFYVFFTFILFTPCFSLTKWSHDLSYEEQHHIAKRQADDSVIDSPQSNDTISDNHDYYTSKIIRDPLGVYWNELVNHTRHILSNDHHLKYSFVTMSFQFPFYGHKINRFAITTQGFLYMSEFTHPDLNWAFTHYVAPLMGNFDTIGNDSHILYHDNGNSFVIEWSNVQLHDQEEYGNYSFQTTLFKNGTIMFGYKSVPNTDIHQTGWPVKVGISDAFYHDVYIPGLRPTRYIVRYHVVELNVTSLGDNMVIILDPLPTCNQATTCEQCTLLRTGFDCSWCSAVSRCSDGYDWYRQEWLDTGCVQNAFNKTGQCPTLTTTTTFFPSTVLSTVPSLTTSTGSTTTTTPSTSTTSTHSPTTTQNTTTTTTPSTTTKRPSTTTTTPSTTSTTPSTTTTTPSTTTTTPITTTTTPSTTTTTTSTTTTTPSTTTTTPSTTTTTPSTTTTTPSTTTTTPSTTTTRPATSSDTAGYTSTSSPAPIETPTVISKAFRSDKGSTSKAAIAIPVAILFVVILFVGVWIFYARTHPNTRSGIWLIEHSPRRIKEKLADIKFSKRSDDKIKVHSDFDNMQADRDVGEVELQM